MKRVFAIFRLAAILLVWPVAVILLARPVAAVQTLDLLFVDPADSTFQVAAEQFKKIVEKKSAGALRVAIHSGGEWGGRTLDELAIVRAVAAGSPAMAIVSAAPLGGYSEEMQAIDIPFIFHDYAQVDKVLDGPIGQRLLDSLRPKGLRGLSFLDCGFRIFSSSKPIKELSDFRNQRVRVMQSRTYVNLMKAFKAVPIPSAVDKIHAMAEKGYIDAADRSYPTYWDFKLYEVQKFITETNHAYAAKLFLVNEPYYASLSPAMQKIVREAALAARIPQRQAFRGQVSKVRRDVKQLGVQIFTLTPAQRADFVRASRPVADQVGRMVGEDLVRQIQNTH
ncbi:MAG: DctP family TRAP transporter solute-binding subunit [Armatimonadetes bacterium]|nr:DctP family TRAP transporter solute-binding subunit [Armatimonadota bacterium]